MVGWRSTIVIATCLSVGCAVVGLVEWYVLANRVNDLVCGIVSDPGTPLRCARPWEPTPKPWFAAAVAFGSLALVGVACGGRRPQVEPGVER